MRNLRRVRRLEENTARNINQNLNIDDEKIDVLVARKRNLDDYWRPMVREEYLAIRALPIETNKFELKLTLLTMVRHHTLYGHTFQDLDDHLDTFMRFANTMKING